MCSSDLFRPAVLPLGRFGVLVRAQPGQPQQGLPVLVSLLKRITRKQRLLSLFPQQPQHFSCSRGPYSAGRDGSVAAPPCGLSTGHCSLFSHGRGRVWGAPLSGGCRRSPSRRRAHEKPSQTKKDRRRAPSPPVLISILQVSKTRIPKMPFARVMRSAAARLHTFKPEVFVVSPPCVIV